jgi:hypothetical protein
MSKFNGIIVVGCTVLALTLSHTAMGATEDFESQTVTSGGSWVPTLAADGWQINGMYDVAGGQNQDIIVDGGSQVLSYSSNNSYGSQSLYGTHDPMWDSNGPADSASAVTTSGFDIKLLGNTLGSEFVGEFGRFDDGNGFLSHQDTWEVGFRVGGFGDFATPLGPAAGTGTYVYLRTWISGGTWLEETIPGPGESADLVGDGNWYSVEVEEDNTTQQTRARYQVRGGTAGAWTAWQDHNAASTYSGGGGVRGWIAGDMLLDNFYIVPEPATMALMGLGAMTMLLRRRAA